MAHKFHLVKFAEKNKVLISWLKYSYVSDKFLWAGTMQILQVSFMILISVILLLTIDPIGYLQCEIQPVTASILVFNIIACNGIYLFLYFVMRPFVWWILANILNYLDDDFHRTNYESYSVNDF